MTPDPSSDLRTTPHTYEASGVARLDETPGFRSLIGALRATFALRPDTGRSLLDFGYYATVLDLGPTTQALAFSTDGVGTKAIAAQLADRYDTVGIDCVAMNVNDILCVGAEPVAMLDYLACDLASDRLLSEIGVGLLEGARQANISIPGGEISQIKDIITGPRPGYAFDLVGTAIGLVDRDRIIVGQDIQPGHAVVGLASSGIHSNGVTLARKVLLESAAITIDTHVPEFGRTLGEELLEPTRIYVKAVLPLLREPSSGGVSGLFHLTSDGFLNLLRCRADVGFEIDALPEPQPVFQMIQRLGNVEDAEMYQVFNMGVGFCVVCEPAAVPGVIAHAKAAAVDAWEIGRAIPASPREGSGKAVYLREKNLVGKNGRFAPA
jgi:phosphoribosylformylglycinamidine cyclo-ligase